MPRKTGAPDRTRTCNLRLSLPLQFSLPPGLVGPGSLWSGLYLRHRRRGTYSLYGSRRGPAQPHLRYGVAIHRFPRCSHRPSALRVHRYSALHSASSSSQRRLLLLQPAGCKHEGRCSIRLSYGRSQLIKSPCTFSPREAGDAVLRVCADCLSLQRVRVVLWSRTFLNQS